jgi:hypothetical protein
MTWRTPAIVVGTFLVLLCAGQLLARTDLSHALIGFPWRMGGMFAFFAVRPLQKK